MEPDSSGAADGATPWRISLDYSYNNANQLIQDTTRRKSRESYPASDGGTNGLGVRNRYEKLVAGASYDYSEKLTIGVTLPFVRNERWEDHHHYSDYTSQGLGDITIYAKYWLRHEKDAFNGYIDLALGLPTGKSDGKFTYIPEKATEPTTKYKASYIQEGLGQWVPILGLGFEKNISSMTTLYGRAQYSDPQGTNNAGYKSQNNLLANLGAGYTFEPSGQKVYGVTGQFNYIYAQFRKDQRDGKDVDNTGGVWLDFQPGAFFSPNGGKLLFSISAPVNIYYDVNSIQTYAPWMVNVGVSSRF
ncbi:MAG: hypothetical protein OEV92_07105 [Nitrospinota bacterium]|nr:hypothetical protein [Nitrospinota bacterium]